MRVLQSVSKRPSNGKDSILALVMEITLLVTGGEYGSEAAGEYPECD